MSGAALLAGLQLVLAGAGEPPELAPYRALALDPAAAHALLRAANEGIRAGLGAAAVPAAAPAAAPSGRDSAAAAWPGSVRPLYVTLVRGRATRACVGSDVPPGGTLRAALRTLGAQVVASDTRHPPLEPRELDSLEVVIAFASDPQPVADPLALDPVREGLKIETERGAMAFLPGEARTVSWALREARRIGVLAGPEREARFYRFSVVTIRGPAERVRPDQE